MVAVDPTGNTSQPPRRQGREHPGASGTEQPAPKRYRGNETRAAWLLLAPDLIGLLLFLIIPMALAIGFAFFRISGFGQYSFAGLDNFARLVRDPQFWSSARISVVYAVAFVVIVFVLGLALALLTKDAFRGLGIVRTILFTPYVISMVVVGVLWEFLLTQKIGFFAAILRPFGLGDESWLGDPRFALGTLVVISVWIFAGYYMLIFIAGLMDIPQEFYDAAQLDGAGRWKLFRYITWPNLRPTSFFVLLTSIIFSIAGPQAFDLIWVTTRGGPANSTETLVTYIYQQAFEFNDFGYASAISAVLLVALLVTVGLLFRLTRGGRFDD